MNWIDFSGHGEPAGHARRRSCRAMQAAFSRRRAQLLRPTARRTRCARVLARQLRPARGVVPVRARPCGDMVRAVAPDLPALHRGRGHAWPGGVRARSRQCRPPAWSRSLSPAGFVVPDPQAAARHGVSFDAAVLANPGYPTSRLLPQPTLLALPGDVRLGGGGRALHRAHAGGRKHGALAPDHRNLVVVRSLSESFAMPGMPVSYCVAHPDTIAQIAPASTIRRASPMLAEVHRRARPDRAAGIWSARASSWTTEIPLAAVHAQPHARHQHLSCRGELRHVRVRATTRAWTWAWRAPRSWRARLQLAGFLIRKLRGHRRGSPTAKYFCVAVRTARGQREARGRPARDHLPGLAAGRCPPGVPGPCRPRHPSHAAPVLGLRPKEAVPRAFSARRGASRSCGAAGRGLARRGPPPRARRGAGAPPWRRRPRPVRPPPAPRSRARPSTRSDHARRRAPPRPGPRPACTASRVVVPMTDGGAFSSTRGKARVRPARARLREQPPGQGRWRRPETRRRASITSKLVVVPQVHHHAAAPP